MWLPTIICNRSATPRSALDDLRQRMTTTLSRRNTVTALQVLATRYNTPATLSPEELLRPLEMRLRSLEAVVQVDAIPLIDEGSRTKKVAVVINDERPVEMAVDSGAE